VVVVPGEKGTLYPLAAAPKDIARIIGKQNHTARSIRIILSAIAAKLKRKVSLEISA